MKVILLTHTKDVLRAVYTAARTCYSADFPEEIWNKNTPLDKQKKLLEKILKSGHYSVLEHVSFTFAVEGISRVASHQLVRHRIASYSQQSQRYVNFSKKYSYVVPPTIKKNEKFKEKYEKLMKNIHNLYKEMVNEGIPPEDARFIFPNATTTNIIVTMNARALHNFLRLRCCMRAQWEIRKMARMMLNILKKEFPIIFKNAGPTCEVEGYCPEGEFSCGKAPTKRN